jgi:hypothetical protein
MSRVSKRHGVASAASNQAESPGSPWSAYTPREARSDVEYALQGAEQRARVAWRGTARTLGACVGNERGKRFARRSRMRREERLQSVRLVEDAVAPAFERREARALALRSLGPRRERVADRRRIDVAHQPPDVLQLPAPRFVLRDLARDRDRVGERLGKVQRREALRIECNERHAEFLQRVHVLLAPRLRRRRIGAARRLGRGHGNGMARRRR